MLTVRAGSMVFYESTAEGFLIGPKGLDGWDSGPGIRRDTAERPQALGNFDAPGFPGTRTVSVSGTCLAASGPDLDWRGSQLTGLGADGGVVRVVVEKNGRPLFADGRLDGVTEFDQIGPKAATYQIQFWFADPRRFGEVRESVAASPVIIAAHHFGNFAATPVVAVTGTMPSGYSVWGPGGRQFIVTAALAAGATHTIDMATGLFRVNGAIVFGAVSRADTWSVPPGASADFQLVPVSGAGSITVSVVDTFV